MESAVAPVIAHVGHILPDLAIYLGPILVIGALLKLSDIRAARRKRDGDGKRR
jgi:hypothetical protein